MKMINKQYPQSVKSMRMLGMYHEAIADHDKARHIYNELIQTNPQDAQTFKRLVALERDAGKSNEAIILLNKYLEGVNQ